MYRWLARDAVLEAQDLTASFSMGVESIVRLADRAIAGTAYKKYGKKLIARLTTLSGEPGFGPLFLKAYHVRNDSTFEIKTPTVEYWGPLLPRRAFDESIEP